jgi:hypothetical protein
MSKVKTAMTNEMKNDELMMNGQFNSALDSSALCGKKVGERPWKFGCIRL